MKRRDFLRLATAATLAAPFRALAQQPQMKRLAFIFTLPKEDPRTPHFLQSLRDGLGSQGWAEGKNLSIDYQWGINTPALSVEAGAAALAQHPDVIFAATYLTFAAPPMPVPGSGEVPIVFALGDPASAGLVKNLGHPEGNITGFLNKGSGADIDSLIRLLAEAAPGIKRAGYMNDPTTDTDTYLATFDRFSSAAKALRIEPASLPVTNGDQIFSALREFAAGPSGGVVIEAIPSAINRLLVANEMVRFHLPAVYGVDAFADVGGLVTYDLNPFDIIQAGGEYVGRVLNGAKIADLPIQAASKYRMVVNLKTARALGLVVPPSVVARADLVVQ